MSDWLRRGRAWVFGDDVDTDQLAPWHTMGMRWEERKQYVMPTRPGWVDAIRPGDLIVAGRNWGCGSSRELAPENLIRLGIGAVIAESFARIYFRNSVALGFPQLECAGLRDVCEDGDSLEVDLEAACVRHVPSGTVLDGVPYAPEMLEILDAGGLLEVLKRRRVPADS